MKINGENYCIDYDEQSTTVNFQGSLRLSGMSEYAPIVELLNQVTEQNLNQLNINLKDLEFLNSSGISMLSKFVINIRNKKNVNLTIIGSDSIPWQGKSLKNLQRLMPSLNLEIL